MTRIRESSIAETKSAMGIDFKSLKERLVEEDKFLLSLIDTIPPKFYFDQEMKEKITAQKHRAMNQAAAALKIGAHGKEISSKNKHKRARLDPSQHKSVTEIQEITSKDKKRKQTDRKAKKNAALLSASLTRATNIEELKQRLKQRVKDLQEKRRKDLTDVKGHKRIKTKEKKNNRQKGNLNKSKMNPDAMDNVPKPKVEKTDLKPKPIYNKEGKIIYSKFDFAESGENVRESKKKKKNKLTGKNYQDLLHKIEKESEKIKSIKEENPEKASQLIQKKAYERAIQKAEGLKVKDDPALLKKSMKRQEKMKKKSVQEWQKRKETTENLMKKKQDKRKRNIQNKKKEKIDNKIKKAKKRGRIMPGF